MRAYVRGYYEGPVACIINVRGCCKGPVACI
jgi:hypothetical protein